MISNDVLGIAVDSELFHYAVIFPTNYIDNGDLIMEWLKSKK